MTKSHRLFNLNIQRKKETCCEPGKANGNIQGWREAKQAVVVITFVISCHYYASSVQVVGPKPAPRT